MVSEYAHTHFCDCDVWQLRYTLASASTPVLTWTGRSRPSCHCAMTPCLSASEQGNNWWYVWWLQISIAERLIVDFVGFLFLSIIPGFIQIIVVIIAIFGLCLYKHRLIVVVSTASLATYLYYHHNPLHHLEKTSACVLGQGVYI